MADRYYYSGVRRSCPVFQTDITELTYFTSRVANRDKKCDEFQEAEGDSGMHNSTVMSGESDRQPGCIRGRIKKNREMTLPVRLIANPLSRACMTYL